MPLSGASAAVKELVQDYQVRSGLPGLTEQDAFTPFWLNRHHHASMQEAAAHAASGSGDFGLDGFHIAADTDGGATLFLYQAKYSPSRSALRQGVGDLTRVAPAIAALLSGRELENGSANPILSRLDAALRLSSIPRESLKIQFGLLHLCSDDQELIGESVSAAQGEFEATVGDVFSANVVFPLEFIGPETILGVRGALATPRPQRTLWFDGAELQHSPSVRYYAGLGRLSDLVGLYEEFRDALFERNVRLYLYSEAKSGPASHMRQTLREICDRRKQRRLPAECFAMFHNGVTVYARDASLSDGHLKLREPSVLNGCQTVKNAYFFLNDSAFAPHLDKEQWERVPVPLRVVVSSDEGFIRQVAVANNRQTEIRPSAFYANEPGQVRLAQRFAAAGVFYERQEGAYKNLRNSASSEFFELYQNSLDGPITLEELAQSIATAADQPALSVAAKVSSLFEESPYKKVFDARHLQSVELLVFLRNLLRWMPAVLLDLRRSSDTAARRFENLPVGRFKYPCTRILSRYIVEHDGDAVSDFGQSVLGRSSRAREFRDYLARQMTGRCSGLARLLVENWGDGPGGWLNALDAKLANQALAATGLGRCDVFSAYGPY